MLRKIRSTALVMATVTALALGAVGAVAGVASASVIPVYNVSVGSSNGGVAGYYWGDDQHTNWRYTQTTVIASPTLNDLNGTTSSTLGAVGTELCNENGGHGNGVAAQIGLYYTGSAYGVAYDFGDFASNSFDDPCIQAGFINPDIESAPQLLSHTVIHTGDRIELAIFYSPAAGAHGRHTLAFGVTDLSQLNEARSHDESVTAQSFTEFGTGVVSDAANVTAALDNNLETYTNSTVNFYSAHTAAKPVGDEGTGFGGIGGLTMAQYVNVSDQPEISPNGSLNGPNFTVYEGSTTP
jgi:hypothetical protein